jgi:hypothetical protein
VVELARDGHRAGDEAGATELSEPRPLPPLPRPFAPAPRPLRATPGCGRAGLIGCGVLVILFGVAAVALSFRADAVMVWLFRQIESRVEARLPPDLTPAERERFDEAFASLYRSLEMGRVEPASMQALQGELMATAGRVERGLTREQVLALTAAVEQAAAGSAPSPRPSPTPLGLPGPEAPPR